MSRTPESTVHPIPCTVTTLRKQSLSVYTAVIMGAANSGGLVIPPRPTNERDAFHAHVFFRPIALRFCGDFLVVRSSNEYGCSFFEEVVVNGITTSAGFPGFIFLLYKLSQVDDAFKIRRELTCTSAGSMSSICKRTVECAGLFGNRIPLWMW